MRKITVMFMTIGALALAACEDTSPPADESPVDPVIENPSDSPVVDQRERIEELRDDKPVTE